MKRTYCLITGMLALSLSANARPGQSACQEAVSAQIYVDQGHAWRPPFGVERVGRPLIARVEFAAPRAPRREYYLIASRGGHSEPRPLTLTGSRSPYWGTAAPLSLIPDTVALFARCKATGEVESLARTVVDWPTLEADAEARPERPTNPVDLGAILVPQGGLLLARGQTALIEGAALSHGRAIPGAVLRAGFDAEPAVTTPLPLTADRRSAATLRVPLRSMNDHAVLHVSLVDGNHELWNKDISTMVVAQAPRWPAFGAVETKLRYDALIPVSDPKTHAAQPPLDYPTAWDPALNDVVVALPNGARFVFWRGASYAPFWAGPHNTGLSYQWAEDNVPPVDFNALDCTEAMQDKALKYGRVRIVESTASRVHVRWTYDLNDLAYQRPGDTVAEDYYFYPDGFGTRVVTLSKRPGTDYSFSEFIVVRPQGAYPLDVVAAPRVDVLFLEGGKKVLKFPLPKEAYGKVSWLDPPERNENNIERILAEGMQRLTRRGETPPAQLAESVNAVLGKVSFPAANAVVYRIAWDAADPAAAVYVSPGAAQSLIAFLPVYDRGEFVSPAHVGDNWPLSRGRPTTMGVINDEHLRTAPGHTALMDIMEPDPFSHGRSKTVDALGHAAEVVTEQRAWLIGKTDAPDAALRQWAQSFSEPPSLSVSGAHQDVPADSAARRAVRLVADSSSIEIQLTPRTHTVNPVFEIDRAPQTLKAVTLDGQVLPAAAYAWDGATLWVRAVIGAGGARIGLLFQ